MFTNKVKIRIIYSFFLWIIFIFQANCRLFSDNKNIIDINSKEKFEAILNKFERLAIILVYTEDPSDIIIEKYINIAETVEYYGDFFHLSCINFNQWKFENYHFSFCTKQSYSDEPAMVIFKPSESIRLPKYPRSHIISILGNVQLNNFQENHIEKYIGDHIFDETLHIGFNDVEIVESQQISNLIILISNKTEVPPIFRGIAKYFKGKLVFGYIKDPLTAKYYEVKNMPQLLGVKLINPKNLTKSDRNVEYYKGPVKFNQMVEFCKNYARKIPFSTFEEEALLNARNEGDDFLPNKYYVLYDSNFSSLLETEVPAILHLYINRPNLNAFKLSEKVRGLFNFYFIKDDVNSRDIMQRYNLTSEKEGKFLSDLHSITKNKTYNLNFDKFSLEYLSDIVPDRTLEIIPEALIDLINWHCKDLQKIVVIYFVNPLGQVPFEYRALALSEYFYPYIKFVVYRNPSLETLIDFKLTNFPQIVGIRSFKDNLTQIFKYSLFHYNDEFKSDLLVTYFKKVVRTEFKKEIEERNNFELIQINEMNYSTANLTCFNEKHQCLLAFVPATDTIQQRKQLNIIREGISTASRIQAKFMWVNSTCHSDLLRDYELNVMKVPTIVSINFKRRVFSNMEGPFDINNIKDFVNKVVTGKRLKIDSLIEYQVPRKVNCSLLFHGETEPLSKEERKMVDKILEEDRIKKEEAKGGKKKKKKIKEKPKKPKKKEFIEDI